MGRSIADMYPAFCWEQFVSRALMGSAHASLPERGPPVPGHRQAPDAPPIACESVRVPARDGSQLFLPFHVRKERQNPPQLGNDGRLNRGCVIVFDESAKSLVTHVSDSHEATYQPGSFTVKRRYTYLCRDRMARRTDGRWCRCVRDEGGRGGQTLWASRAARPV